MSDVIIHAIKVFLTHRQYISTFLPPEALAVLRGSVDMTTIVLSMVSLTSAEASLDHSLGSSGSTLAGLTQSPRICLIN